MLTSVRLKDFKNHIDTEVGLGRLTCLAGPNGCGKTSVLEALSLICTSLNHGAVAFFRGLRRFEDFPRVGESEFSVAFTADSIDSETRRLDIDLRGGPTPPWYSDDEFRKALGFDFSANWKTDWEGGILPADLDRLERAVQKRLRSADEDGDCQITFEAWDRERLPNGYAVLVPTAFLFLPTISDLRIPSYVDTEVPALTVTGSTLPSVIAYLITTEPERFALLMQRIREVLPRVQRLRTRPAKVELNEPAQVSTRGKEIHYQETREVIGHELLFDLTDAPGIPARAVSEGTLLVTALLTATVWNQGADLLLIDDLEKGLHPRAQRELVQALKRLLDSDSNLQIVFSTHSPYIIDELAADQVWIMVADEARGVITRRLSDHPRAASALEVLSTGEFLDAEGEDWVRETADAD